MDIAPASQKKDQIKVVTGVPEVVFANWREALHGSGIPRHVRTSYEYGIGRFLEYCVTSGQSVTRQTASNFLSDAHRRHLAPPDGLWEQEVDWFFVNGQQRCAAQPDGVPSIGKADIGKTAWERRMIERLRLQHYSWRTEQTYRDWARRFANTPATKICPARQTITSRGFFQTSQSKGGCRPRRKSKRSIHSYCGSVDA